MVETLALAGGLSFGGTDQQGENMKFICKQEAEPDAYRGDANAWPNGIYVGKTGVVLVQDQHVCRIDSHVPVMSVSERVVCHFSNEYYKVAPGTRIVIEA